MGGGGGNKLHKIIESLDLLCCAQSLSHVWLFVTPWTDCSLPGSSVPGILQARILEWVAISFSREYSWPRAGTQVSLIAGGHFNLWATREPLLHSIYLFKSAVFLNKTVKLIWWELENQARPFGEMDGEAVLTAKHSLLPLIRGVWCNWRDANI